MHLQPALASAGAVRKAWVRRGGDEAVEGAGKTTFENLNLFHISGKAGGAPGARHDGVARLEFPLQVPVSVALDNVCCGLDGRGGLLRGRQGALWRERRDTRRGTRG